MTSSTPPTNHSDRTFRTAGMIAAFGFGALLAVANIVGVLWWATHNNPAAIIAAAIMGAVAGITATAVIVGRALTTNRGDTK